MEQRDVVVVGAGVMGLASAWALKRAGRDAVVLEQFEVGHPHGSSHGSARIFRFAYDDPAWVALAQEALPLWRELEEQSGETLLWLTGLLDSSSDREPLRAALALRGAEHELLAEGETGRRFGIELDGEVVLELHGGTVRAGRALAAFGGDVEVRESCRVLRLSQGNGGVHLETSAGPIGAQLAVVAAGAWATPLLAEAGIDLETSVSRETVAYFDLPGAHTLPSVIDWHERMGRHAYSLADREDVLKVGLHHSGTSAIAGEGGAADPAIVDAIAEWVAMRYPAADPRPTGAETCLYTNIEADRFVIERHGAIVECSACSGHGFKFAPAVGVQVARLCGD